MIPEERRRQLLAIVTEHGVATIPQLTEQLGVSHMTVRRDIALLEQGGRVVSVSGGIALPSRMVLDASHETKLGLQPIEKREIAALAAALVEPGELVYLDAGTTTLALAQRLAETERVDVVTNDLAVAAAAGASAAAQVHLLGGRLDAPNQATEGAMAAAAVSQFNIGVAFLSASSFDLRGISVPTDAKAVLKRAVVDHAERVYLLTDSTKYGRVAALRAVALTEFDGLITDSRLPETARAHLAELGLELHVASTPAAEEAAHRAPTTVKGHTA
ncbi:DeoR/GlpR family DNA-binding transcription regulator [Leucobacter sp. PH1c]|uniref:DeoR/GlpR family DNA-binding transcription regulator n=1 Tax=Leucobacter sp. PH1c TaxID=1397278 RepID=UPI000468E43C|nr:DeoR/GlpR family DNA-binding transcription regulator [Leucobacter sp. PH1c]